MSMAGKCKVVRGRKLCWGKNGRIKSNTPASGGTRKRKPAKRRAAASSRKRTVRKGARRTTRSTTRSSASTFRAKASYAVTKCGKLRKGCRKVAGVYRCRKPGKRAR